MKITSVLFALTLAGCASYTLPPAGTPAPAQINVVVNANEALRPVIDVNHFEELTRAAMAKYATNAAPATITVELKSIRAIPERRVLWGGAYQHVVPSLSPEPRADGVIPMVTVGSYPIPVLSPEWTAVVHGSYTITDASGRVLEQKSFAMAPGTSTGAGTLRDEPGAAALLAKRVAKVMRGQSS